MNEHMSHIAKMQYLVYPIRHPFTARFTVMGLTAEQHLIRSQGIGASEIAIILGFDRHRTPLELWLDKRGQLTKDEQPWLDRGIRLEPYVAAHYQERHPDVAVTRHGRTTVHPTHKLVIATPDYEVQTYTRHPLSPDEGGGVLEMTHRKLLQIKTIRPTREVLREFGVQGTDEVPMAFAAQEQWELLATNLEEAHIAVLFGLDDYREYVILADDGLQEEMVDAATEWWQRHIVEGVEPPIEGYAGAHYLAKKFKQTTDIIRDASEEAVVAMDNLAKVEAGIDDLDKMKVEIQNVLKQEITEFRGLQSPQGHRVLWVQAKDSVKTDWEKVAGAYRTMLELYIMDEKMADTIQGAFVEHTKTAPGSRRFLFYPAKGDK